MRCEKPRGAAGQCGAMPCDRWCGANHLMCAHHWAMVPKEIQRRIYAAYRSQEYREGDTTEHSLAVYDAVKAVRTVQKGPGGDLCSSGVEG